MGYSRYDPDTWAGYSAATASRTPHDYGRSAIFPDFDPKRFAMRESRKSALNPNATPIIAALDVTGSMGRVVEAMRKGLGTLFEEIIDRRPVPDPHVMAMAIGDFECDSAPVQATQFEADPVAIGKQVEDLWLERGGGSNNFEGYLGPLYFAGMRTDCDAIREGRKGFLFTVGDEEPQKILRASHVQRFFGDAVQRDMAAEELVTLVERGWEYFHLMVLEGSYMRSRPDTVKQAWTDLLGQRALPLSDHTRMAEVIISAIEVATGRDKDTVAKSWSGSTSLVVSHAIGGLTVAAAGRRSAKGPRVI
jgi:hypothetical protein